MRKHQLTERGTFISKTEAGMLQAVAVMLMVWHHLFGFPDRITVPYVLLADGLFHIETLLSYFGRICIVVFAFSSGYGMRKRAANRQAPENLLQCYWGTVKQLLKFYSRYWMVFFVFVPVCFIMGAADFNWEQFLWAVVGKGAVYNAEWWYITYYVRFLLLFPLISMLMDLLRRYLPFLLHVLMFGYLLGILLLPSSMLASSFSVVFVCFIEGMYCAECNLFELIHRFLPKKSWINGLLGIVLLGLVFVLRTLRIPDYLLVADFVLAVLLIFKWDGLMRRLRPLLTFVGKYSTYIWLTHTFFGYYLFQKITFFPRYSWLIFLWCMVLSIGTGMILEWLISLICKAVKCRKAA